MKTGDGCSVHRRYKQTTLPNNGRTLYHCRAPFFLLVSRSLPPWRTFHPWRWLVVFSLVAKMHTPPMFSHRSNERCVRFHIAYSWRASPTKQEYHYGHNNNMAEYFRAYARAPLTIYCHSIFHSGKKDQRKHKSTCGCAARTAHIWSGIIAECTKS